MTLYILWGKAAEVFSYGRRYLLEFLRIGIIGTSIPSSLLLYGVALSPVSNVFSNSDRSCLQHDFKQHIVRGENRQKTDTIIYSSLSRGSPNYDGG